MSAAPAPVDRNAPEHWNRVWSEPERQAWRDDALAPVYTRIAELLQELPRDLVVVDLGGGVGHLARRIAESRSVVVYEHNEAALAACMRSGIAAVQADLRKELPPLGGAIVTATEVLEHLDDDTLCRVLDDVAGTGRPAFFSVPNDRLTPAEEPEHCRAWTALGFLELLRTRWPDARVEVLGHPARLPRDTFPSDRGQPSNLLGIVGMGARAQKVSMTMPVRDEAADLEETLASFRGFVDEIVVGVDPRTTDATREIAAKYADVVFELGELRGPPDKPEEWVDERGIHFAHARNQCIDRCQGPWIFMTEGHERLRRKGADTLLHLDQLPAATQVVGVVRTSGHVLFRQQWVFPWLHRKSPKIRFERGTHNTLGFPDDALMVVAPQLVTIHERVHTKDVERQAQRKVQNRRALYDDWMRRGSEYSLHYLGAEWREWDREKAVQYLREYLAIGKSGALRYQTRLVLAKELAQLGRGEEAAEVLHGATADDWSRSEHLVFLGDLAAARDATEEALTFYGYAACRIGRPPVSTWFVDLPLYGWMTAQRMAECHAALGQLAEAEGWAERVLALLAEDEAPEEFLDEARKNLALIQEARNGRAEESG